MISSTTVSDNHPDRRPRVDPVTASLVRDRQQHALAIFYSLDSSQEKGVIATPYDPVYLEDDF